MRKEIPTERRRQLLLRLIDGDPRLPPVAFEWNKLRRCEEVVTWCIRSGLTGKSLFEWLRGNFGMRILEPAKWVLSELDRGSEPQAILVGRDYRTGP